MSSPSVECRRQLTRHRARRPSFRPAPAVLAKMAGRGVDCRRMNDGKADPSYRATLAEEARPVRRWLVGYFRRRVKLEAEVEDLAQEVFARLAARDSSEPVEHMGGYILKTASSVLADWSRRRDARGAVLQVTLDPE